MAYTLGIPIKLLHEAKGLVVSIEIKTGQTYKGKLLNVEDNMNMQLKEVTVIARDGQVTTTDTCFLRGSNIRFVAVPDNLRFAPLFKSASSISAASRREKRARTVAGASVQGA
jgi:small nuclear ribonucleoprotein D3